MSGPNRQGRDVLHRRRTTCPGSIARTIGAVADFVSTRPFLAWLLSLPLMLAGVLTAQRLAYELVVPHDHGRGQVLAQTGHGYLEHAPLGLGFGGGEPDLRPPRLCAGQRRTPASGLPRRAPSSVLIALAAGWIPFRRRGAQSLRRRT